MPKLFEPSSEKLLAMIEQAEAKFWASHKAARKAEAERRADAAMAHNRHVVRAHVERAFPRSGTVKGNPF